MNHDKMLKKNFIEEIDLINLWILEKLNKLQKEYKKNLEKDTKTNIITKKIINFIKEDFSNNYLEIIKKITLEKKSKKNLLFVYQQLLIMFHPIAPFITQYIYKKLTKINILEEKIIFFEKEITKENNLKNIWKIDLLIIIIDRIRKIENKEIDINLEIFSNWEKEKFDYESIVRIFFDNKKINFVKKENFHYFFDLSYFGNLWYKKENKIELEKKINFYENECKRSEKILSNENFIKKAPLKLVENEKKKLIYYQKQKKKLQWKK